MTKGGPAVAVDIDGEVLTWHDGRLVGNEDSKKRARNASELGLEVSLLWGIPPVKANLEPNGDQYDYVGIAAALVSVSPGRAVLIEFPGEVEEYLSKWDVPDSEVAPGEEVIY